MARRPSAMPRFEALDLARELLSLLVGAAVINLDEAPERARNRMVDTLRLRLIPAHVSEEAFEAATAATE